MAEPEDSHLCDAIPLEAFFGEGLQPNPVTQDLVLQADLIVGIDVMTRQEYVVYGKAALKRIAETGQPEDLHVLHVAMDSPVNDLERLCALVTALKGRHDYGPDWESR